MVHFAENLTLCLWKTESDGRCDVFTRLLSPAKIFVATGHSISRQSLALTMRMDLTNKNNGIFFFSFNPLVDFSSFIQLGG